MIGWLIFVLVVLVVAYAIDEWRLNRRADELDRRDNDRDG